MSGVSREHLDLLGHDVIVENPNGSASWKGRAIAIAEQPSIVIEGDDGSRQTLPLDWTRLDPAQRTWVRTAGIAPRESDTSGEGAAYEIAIDMLEDLLVNTGEVADLDEHGLLIRKTAGALVFKINARMQETRR